MLRPYVLDIRSDSTMLVKIIWEPMDRSIPPETITNINPTALIVTKDICLNMSLKLLKVRKLGAMNEKTTIATSNTNKGAYFLTMIRRFPDRMFNSEGLFFIYVSIQKVYSTKICSQENGAFFVASCKYVCIRDFLKN